MGSLSLEQYRALRQKMGDRRPVGMDLDKIEGFLKKVFEDKPIDQILK
jgi:hypothetical protein